MPSGNFSFVIDSSFNPMSFRDRLAPFLIAKEAYDKAEQEYIDRQDKIDKYSFLNDYDDKSPAKQLYQGYVNEYNRSFDDFSKNGLSQGNRRSWLNVRRRYQKNIGRLEDADKAMQEELTRRQTLDANDPTRIYAKDTVNLSIDDYLDRKKPNDYSVSGQKLYERGVQIGASDSSRIWSNPKVQQINKYYQAIEQTTGRNPQLLAAWANDLSSIPELRDQVMSNLKAMGVTDNLTGVNYDRALQSIVSGVINGSTYKVADNIQRDLSVMTPVEQSEANYRAGSLALQQDELNWKKQEAQRNENWIYTHDDKGNRTGYNPQISGGTSGVPDGFYQDPKDGQLKRTPKGYKPDASSPTGLVKDDSNDASSSNSFNNKLLALRGKDLGHNDGFDVEAAGDRLHYDYIGAVEAQNGGYVSGAIGDDVPNRGWGFTSASNVMSKWGNFSAEGINNSEKKNTRVLSESELTNLYTHDANFVKELNKLAQNAKVDLEKDDIQVIAVPNEHGAGRNGYLIAVHRQ